MLDVLAFGAHPDDAETACGGLLAKLARRGYRVAICDLTRGELATNGTPDERAREAEAAARVLGLAARLQLALPDGGLDGGDPRQAEAVVRTLRAEAPRLVLGPHPHARHPDHVEAARLVRRARFFASVARFAPGVGPPVPRPVHLRALDFWPLRPSFVVDIGAELPTKLAALGCYRSQFERGEESRATILNDPAYLQRVETAARHYGALIGSSAGEPYVMDGAVPLDDPVAALAPQPGEVRR